MILGKIENGAIVLVNVEGGREIGGKKRSEADLLADGFKKACPAHTDKPTTWREFPSCLVEVELPDEMEE